MQTDIHPVRSSQSKIFKFSGINSSSCESSWKVVDFRVSSCDRTEGWALISTT